MGCFFTEPRVIFVIAPVLSHLLTCCYRYTFNHFRNYKQDKNDQMGRFLEHRRNTKQLNIKSVLKNNFIVTVEGSLLPDT